MALALFRKADRLSFELTGDEMFSLPLIASVAQIRPGHVLRVLDAASAEITNVKQELGITETVASPVREPSRVPSDVLGQCFSVNRVLNLLLEQPFSPSDVFQQLHVARDLLKGLVLGLGGDPESIPVPAYERRRRPTDVFGSLLGTFETLRTAAVSSGLEMLKIKSGLTASDEIVPGDVFDVASLVLAEVAYLHGHLGNPAVSEIFASHHLGRKLPSHCFQIAQHLGLLAKQFAGLAEKQSDWAKSKK